MFNDLLKIQDDLTRLYLDIIIDKRDIEHVRGRILDIIQGIYKTVDQTVSDHSRQYEEETRKQETEIQAA